MNLLETFGHLHAHTCFSLLDSVIKIEDLVKKVKELGQKHIAITDHGNIDGILKFYNECKKQGIQPIIGCEIYITDDIYKRPPKGSKKKKKSKEENIEIVEEKKDEETEKIRNYHAVVLCKNLQGLQNLMKLLTIANNDGFYYKPRIDWNHLLVTLDENNIIMTGCAGGVLSHSDYENKIIMLKEKFGSDLYLETMPLWDLEMQKDINRKAFDLSKKLDIKLVVTADCHYIEKEDFEFHEVHLAIGQKGRNNKKIKWNDPDRWKFGSQLHYVSSAKEIIINMKKSDFTDEQIKECFTSVSEIINKCKDFKLEKFKPCIPSICNSEKEEIEMFVKQTTEGRDKRGLIGQEVNDRLKLEMQRIIKNGFARYFLITADLVQYAKKHMLVGCARGSSAGSLVAYCLGITDVNPLRYGLIFERFMAEGRTDFPDIDIDFEDSKRWMILKYLEEKYNYNNIANVSSFTKIKGRMAIREIAKLFEVPDDEIDKLAKSVTSKKYADENQDESLAEALEMFEYAKEFKSKYPKVCEYACKIEGLYKNAGAHPAGIIVNDKNLFEGEQCVILSRGKHDKCVNWDREDIEFFGLIKWDILGLSILSSISEALKFANLNPDIIEDIINSNMDDPKVYHEFQQGHTTGIHEFSTDGMKTFMQRVKPTKFEDISAINALYRPGTLSAGFHEDYIVRKNGSSTIYKHELLKKYTEETYGLIVYQEQIMFMLNILAGMPWSDCDKVRKIIAKSKGVEELLKYKEQFINGCLKNNTLSQIEAEEFFEQLKGFGKYVFNKSHTVAYAIIAYISMYLKTYYPHEYLVACINNSKVEDKPAFIRDMKRIKIKFEYPDINLSDAKWTVKKGRAICGLSEIDGLGDKAAEEIIKSRGNNAFVSEKDFLNRVSKRIVNVRVRERLKQANAFFNKGENDPEEVEKLFKFKWFIDENFEYKKYLERGKIKKDIYVDKQEVLNSDEFKNIKCKRKENTVALVYGEIEKCKVELIEDKFPEQATSWKKYFTMLTSKEGIVFGIDNDFFIQNKELCENLKEKFVLCLAEKSEGKNDRIFYKAKKIWVMENHFENPYQDFPLTLIQIPSKEILIDSVNCLKECRSCSKFADKSCSFSENTINPVPLQIGRKAKNILIIAESPGETEEKQKKPLVGRAGNQLWRRIERNGFDYENFFVSNIIKCRPKDNKITNGNAEDIIMCSNKYLKNEIKSIKPIVILALGRYACKYFGKEGSVLEYNGKIEWDQEYRCFVVYSVHPSSIFYAPENEDKLDLAINNFCNLIKTI